MSHIAFRKERGVTSTGGVELVRRIGKKGIVLEIDLEDYTLFYPVEISCGWWYNI